MARRCRSCCTPSSCGYLIVAPSCSAAGVATITLTLGGTTIASGPTVSGVRTASVGSGGTLYLSAPAVTLSGGGGSGAAAAATLGTVALRSVTLTNAGSGYTTAPNVAVSGSATVQAKLSPGGVASANVTAGGSGYTSATVDFFDTNGDVSTVATGTVTLSGGVVTGITITSAGSGYTSAPDVTITGDGSGATAVSLLTAGPVASLTITSAGSGYTSNPTLAIDPPGGGGTTATATGKAGGSVSGLRVTATGSGYTAAPTVTIAAPQAGGTTATGTAAIAVVFGTEYTAAGSYTITGTGTGLNSASTGVTLACTGATTTNVNLTMFAATGYSCSPNPCCPIADQPGPPYALVAFPTTIHCTDPYGTVALTWNGSVANPLYAGHANRVANSSVNNCTANVAQPANSNVGVGFQLRCISTSSNAWVALVGPVCCGLGVADASNTTVPSDGIGTTSAMSIDSCSSFNASFSFDVSTLGFIPRSCAADVYGTGVVTFTFSL